jgi:hypothetical protein
MLCGSRPALRQEGRMGVLARMAAHLAILVVLVVLGASPAPGTAEPEEAPERGAQPPAEREDFLLREACRYLNLSPQQAGQLLVIARQADERRRLFEQQSERTLRDLEPLAARDPEYVTRARASLEQSRAQVFSQILTFATSQTVRLLTREQIALAWRLAEGHPPKYAQADPALLEPEAGFTQRFAGRRRSPAGSRGQPVPGGGAAGSGAPQGDEAEVEALELLQRALVAEATVEVERLMDAQPQNLQMRRRSSVSSVPARRATERPFPQLVVETADLNELAFAVEPLARRIFFSPRIVPVLLHPGQRRGAAAGPDHRLRLERNRATRVVRGYLDLQPIFAFLDLDDEAVFEDGAGLLFVDDQTTKGEQGPGAVRSVVVWAGL